MVKAKNSKLKIKPLYLIILGILIFGFLAYHFRLDIAIEELSKIPQLSKEKHPPFANYQNPLGFSLVYGKENDLPYQYGCEPGKTEEVTYEDKDSNVVYIAGTKLRDPSCNERDNNLELLKTDKGGFSMKYFYMSAVSDQDLIALAKKAYGNYITSIEKIKIPNTPGVYSVKIIASNSNQQGINFGYDFFYSDVYKVAVASQGVQECVFSSRLKLKGAFGEGCGSQIMFLQSDKEWVDVILKDGTITSGYISEKNNSWAQANVNFGSYGNWRIIKKMDGKWIDAGDDQQAYPCSHFLNMGMTNKDIKEINISEKNGECSSTRYQ